jgi:hypothetical protein
LLISLQLNENSTRSNFGNDYYLLKLPFLPVLFFIVLYVSFFPSLPPPNFSSFSFFFIELLKNNY